MTSDVQVLREIQDAVPGIQAVSAQDHVLVLSDAFCEAFPELARLLRTAEAYTLETTEGPPQIALRWRRRGLLAVFKPRSRGWLVGAPTAGRKEFSEDHRLLLSVLGGIGWSWNAPESFLLNLKHAFDASESTIGFWQGSVEVDHLERNCPEPWARLRMNPSDWICFAREWNGNEHLYERKTGQVICFAPDPGWGMRPLRGFPEGTLCYLPDAPDLRAWIRSVANQWLK